MPTLINPYAYAPGTMLSAIQRLSLTTGLKLCLDAGDINSVASGTQDKWLDTSGNGYDFFRGSGTGGDAADPTFNGVAGRQSSSEYWGFDGGDYFTYDTTNETWMENIHKDGAKFAFAAWVYLSSVGTAQRIIGTHANPGSIGFNIFVGSSGLIGIGVNNGTGTAAYIDSSSIAVPAGQWSFTSVLLDETANQAVVRVNTTEQTVSATYTSPSSSSASSTLLIANATGTASAPLLSGARMSGLMMWEATVPTAAQLLALYNATKAKFGH